MNKNPVVPYAIIAVLGIFAVILISFLGANQRDARENPEENTEEAVTLDDAEAIYKNSCASCHGGDLTGDSAPDLSQVGNRLDEDEIKDIIINGTDGGMPAGQANNEEAGVLAEWLAGKE